MRYGPPPSQNRTWVVSPSGSQSESSLHDLPRNGISYAELQSRFRNGMSLLFGEFIGIRTPALLCAVCSIVCQGSNVSTYVF
jgi:hypothetical protein